jgi:hypothetical protein
MAFLPGYASKVLANEQVVCATVSGWTVNHQRAVSEVTAMCQGSALTGSASYVPGLKSGAITLTGPQDSSGQSLHSEIVNSLGVDNDLQLMLLPDGDAVGKFAIFATLDVTDYATDANVTDAVGFSASAAADESVDMGFVLHALGAETADGNGTSVDRGAGSTSTLGAVAAVHVTAYTGLTSLALKVQHSTDNSVWADLVAFASITGVGKQIVKVDTGTTVNRYLRVVTDVTGTGSVTFLAAAAPR